MFSNKYIYIYTTIMVVAVAALLALAATLLKPFQDKNARVETMQNILKAAGIASTAEDAEALYAARIREELTVNAGGEVLARYGSDGALLNGAGTRAFDISMKNALEAGEDGAFPVFVCRTGDEDSYIVPLYGKGLWGPIWGYITFAPDMNTVLGVSFSHQGETPGLGAEIAGDAFQQPFAGKRIFDAQQRFTSITVQKGGVKNYKGDPVHAVDAISGGTITSTGVTAMLHDCLTYYIPFFNRIQGDSALAVAAATDSLPVEEPAAPVAPAPTPRKVQPAAQPAQPVQPASSEAAAKPVESAAQPAPAPKAEPQPAQPKPAEQPAPAQPAAPETPETPAQPEPQPVQPQQPAEPAQPVEAE